MKNIYYKISAMFFAGNKNTQEQLVEFLHDENNINKAVEGSMQKRLDLIDRVNLQHKNA